MRCADHLQTEAIGTCDYCGKPYCKEGLAEIRGKFFCRAHTVYAFREQPHYPAKVNPPPTIVNNNYIYPADYYPYKSQVAAALLCLLFGMFGIHRFYVGKIGTGLIWFFTLGLFTIGWILDLVFIILGFFKDKAGYPLR